MDVQEKNGSMSGTAKMREKKQSLKRLSLKLYDSGRLLLWDENKSRLFRIEANIKFGFCFKCHNSKIQNVLMCAETVWTVIFFSICKSQRVHIVDVSIECWHHPKQFDSFWCWKWWTNCKKVDIFFGKFRASALLSSLSLLKCWVRCVLHISGGLKRDGRREGQEE